MNRDQNGMPDFMAAIMAGLNQETQGINLNFSNPYFQIPMEVSFDETGFSAPIFLNGERPDWVHDLDIVVFARDTNEAVLAEDVQDEDWDAELAFRVMDRNKNLRLKQMIRNEQNESKPEPEITEDSAYICIAKTSSNTQGAVLGLTAHCSSCVEQNLLAEGYMPQLILSLHEAAVLVQALNEAITAVRAR